MAAEVENLKRDPSPMARLDVTKVVEHYDKIIRGLEWPPIIMGHSLGGTVMQLLLDRGLGAASVGVASATVKGARPAIVDHQGQLSGTSQPVQPQQGDPAQRKAVPLRVREHVEPG
jgi:hypothetical protein